MNTQRHLKQFSAVFIVEGGVRRLFIEAADETEAQETCKRWGAGLEGEAVKPAEESAPPPEAYDAETARHLLGDISRTSLYKEVILGRLKRVPGIRRILITRASLEARCR